MMDNCTREDLQEALRALAVMIARTRKVQEKFAQGTPQSSLLKNRLRALEIASSLISKELAGSSAAGYTKDELDKALAPLASLISKSEKARSKLPPGTWQHSMLSSNLKALYIASPLLSEALRRAAAGNNM